MNIFKRRKVMPEQDNSSLGNVLLKLGKVSEEQLHSALQQQALDQDRRLGALMQEMGLVRAQDVSDALALQQRMRSTKSVVAAEVAVLETAVAENKKQSEKLSQEIAETRRQRREDRQHTGKFLSPYAVKPV